MTDPKSLPTYSQEEVASILSKGLDRGRDGGRISHDELLETAREIGMTTLEIEAAVTETVKLRAAEEELRMARLAAQRRFAQHLVVFVVANALLAVIDVKLAGGVFFYWVALGWGAGLLFHAQRVWKRPRAPEPEARRVEVRDGKMQLVKDEARGPDTPRTRRRAG